MTKRQGDTDGNERTSRKSSKVGQGYDAAFRGYINVSLTKEQKEAFPVWSSGASYWEAFNFFAGDGVNLSVKYEAKSSCFLASGTQRRENSPNAGLVVTARAREAEVALARLLFTLTVLNKSESWESVQPIADPDRW